MEITQYGNPVLRAKGARIPAITEDIIDLAEAMIETMHEANGVGLAAQQVGYALQMAVVDVSGVEDRPSTLRVDGELVDIEEWCPLVFLNPELDLQGEKETASEGCLSFPGISADITRFAITRGKAQLLDGREITFEATGLLARAFQHEVDHLNGILFIDRMNSAAKVALGSKLRRMQKNAQR